MTAPSSHWVYSTAFLREAVKRFSWGHNPAYDNQLLDELAEITGEPRDEITHALTRCAIATYCAIPIDGNDAVH